MVAAAQAGGPDEEAANGGAGLRLGDHTMATPGEMPYGFHQGPEAAASQEGIPTGQTDINELLDQLLSINSQTLEGRMDESQARKESLNCHRLKPALFSILCD